MTLVHIAQATAGVLLRRRPRAVLVAVAATLAACGGGDGSVTVNGDVAGLDSLGFRGDSLLAEADRAPLVLDSLRAAARAEMAKAETDTQSATAAGTLAGPKGRVRDAKTDAGIANAALSAGNVISRRAQARGDSMARAFAAKLTGGGSGADRARGDTLRGQLVWQGTEPVRTVVLRTGSTTVSLSGMATTGMSKLVGSEIVVRGVRITPRDIVVSDYFVRAADGIPAYDGTLQPDGSLRLTDGSGVRRVPLPGSLQGMHGARVWIAVKDNQPYAYGLIAGR